MLKNITEWTLEMAEKLKGAIQKQQSVEKAYTTSLGLNWYDLEPAAKLLFPVITPLRNEIPRVAGNGGNAVNWKALTGINTTNVDAGVSEGNRGAVITVVEEDYTAPYRGLGLEDYETFEAEYGSKNFDDLRALMTQGLLWSLMMKEEQTIVGGNGTTGLALGTPAKPTGALKAGGAMTAQANVCYVVALTLDGYLRSSVAGGVATVFTKTNADGSTDANCKAGSSNKSAESDAVVTAAANLSVEWTVAAVKGAVAYAWFTGLTGAANCSLAAITTTNVFLQVADAAGTQTADLITADNSKSQLNFDGIITQALKGTGYFKSLDGAGLTSDGAGSIVELLAMFKDRWDNYKVSPDRILVNAQELQNINKLVVANGGAPLIRYSGDFKGTPDSRNLVAGTVVGYVLNPYTMGGGQLVEVMLHPNVPPGTIIVYSAKPPYAHSRVRNVLQVKTRKEYYQIDWALRSRKYETGVYVDELLQMYATFCFGVISNIGNK